MRKSILFLFLLPFGACAQQKEPVRDYSKPSHLSVATFASGCFWCVEGIFESVVGVEEVISGYCGGHTDNPDYNQVSTGKSGHAEAVEIYYDSTKVTYGTLLRVFFDSHDPTQVDGQGPDHGKQYRSAIFYRNEQEKKQAMEYISALNNSGELQGPVVTELNEFTRFWPAEIYHQDFVCRNPRQGYVKSESLPRIKKFQAKNPGLIKEDKKY